ncbi:MAG: alkaline phosphatase family protein [Nitrososphaerota archaeon]|nr:alkaline phosphatase family protein [Nitrososphaerota archaeon]
MANKVVFIGIDGAPFGLVTKWAKEGKLPNLLALLNESAYGPLESAIDLTPPGWSSIYSGKNAGKHGIFDFKVHRPGSYEFVSTNSTMRDAEDIWGILSRFGARVGVLNAPVTFPVRPVNGFLVSGFLTPGEQVEYTYPSSLKEELKRAVPDFRPSSSNELQLNLDKDAYTKNVLNEIENLRLATTYIKKKQQDLDFFGVIVSETDHVQHWFWKDMENSGSKQSKYSNVILETYKAVDRLIGEVLHDADENTYVILVSDHGGTRLKKFFHTNYFLHSIGMLNFKTDLRTTIKRILYDKGITQKLYHFLIDRKVFLLHYLLRPLALTIRDIDWSRTAAYSFGYGQIYLNIKGREPQGAISSGQAPETRRLIMDHLSHVSDVSSNNKCPIRAMYTKEEIFSGPHLEEAPDIQLVMLDGYEAFPWASIADGIFTESVDRSGTHNTQGIVAIRGKGVEKGMIEGASVLDIAPTILGIMDVEIPLDMDGHFLSQAFTEQHLQLHSPRQSGTSSKSTQAKYEFTKQEEEQIEESLRSLGYI